MRALAPILALALCASAPAAAAPSPIGIWQNPAGTIRVRTSDCGAGLCGHIVWAAPQAIADARAAGVTALVGTELLIGYRPTGVGRWTGQVYIPDQGHRFYSTIEIKTPDSLRISGCILGGLICKHQEWTRHP